MTLEVEDNGVGFETAPANERFQTPRDWNKPNLKAALNFKPYGKKRINLEAQKTATQGRW